MQPAAKKAPMQFLTIFQVFLCLGFIASIVRRKYLVVKIFFTLGGSEPNCDYLGSKKTTARVVFAYIYELTFLGSSWQVSC